MTTGYTAQILEQAAEITGYIANGTTLVARATVSATKTAVSVAGEEDDAMQSGAFVARAAALATAAGQADTVPAMLLAKNRHPAT